MATLLIASACDSDDPAGASPEPGLPSEAVESPSATEDSTSTETAPATPQTTPPTTTATAEPTEEPTDEGDGGDGGDDGGGGGGFVDNSPEVPCSISAPLSQNARVAQDCAITPLVNVEGFLLYEGAAAAYQEMKEAAAADGITLFIISGYRDYNTQMQLYLQEVAMYGEDQNTSAKPGHSEHQLGTTVDLNSLSQDFGETPEGQWLQQNAASFGFRMSYPAGMEAATGYAYEPWHWRWWG